MPRALRSNERFSHSLFISKQNYFHIGMRKPPACNALRWIMALWPRNGSAVVKKVSIIYVPSMFFKRHSNGSRHLPQNTLNGPLDAAPWLPVLTALTRRRFITPTENHIFSRVLRIALDLSPRTLRNGRVKSRRKNQIGFHRWKRMRGE